MRFSSDVLPRQPFTCAQPVMPAFTLCRSMYCGMRCLNCSTKNGRSGRGPTIDMSPLSTFQNCGHSSRSCVRSHGRPASRADPPRRPTPARCVLGVQRHRAELVDGELLAVQAHALLAVEHRAGRAALDQPRDDRATGSTIRLRAPAEIAMSSAA